MSAAKHTPGPWYADKIIDRNAYNVFPRGATYALLTVAAPVHDGAHPYGAAAEANARLIAAAPELLEALQKLVRDADGEPDGEYLQGANKGCVAVHRSGIERAIAAIAKATGGAE